MLRKYRKFPCQSAVHILWEKLVRKTYNSSHSVQKPDKDCPFGQIRAFAANPFPISLPGLYSSRSCDTVCITRKGAYIVADDCSTKTAALIARVAYVSLRRWLADGSFEEWLKENNRPPLTSVILDNGNKIRRFSIRNRVDLIAFRDRDGGYSAVRGRAAGRRERAKKALR
jgi:hypothetical protein